MDRDNEGTGGEEGEGTKLSGESFRIIHQVCLIDRPKRNDARLRVSCFLSSFFEPRFNPSSHQYFTSHLVLLVGFETVLHFTD